ncbi:hypothetical protein [Kribbella sp. NPDC051770]|uniref:hypothetical protein n=1 Tax=Kribbella sp. NPDC051770 TaxID=3155413 RepID=UPI0034280FFF
MLGRFTVRPSNDGDGTYGVWDGAVNGWRASGLASDLEAERMKADLDLQFNAHGPRPATEVRVVNPATPVQYAADWRPGELDAWVLDAGEWLGRVRAPDGHITWIPGTALRKLEP